MNQPKIRARKRRRPNARDKILDATLKMVGDLGVAAVTLDGVAARAGVSKGGLLYHFPFKDDLLAAANEHLLQKRTAAREAEAKALPAGNTRRLKAYVLASAKDASRTDRIGAKLVLAGAMSATSAEPIRRYFRDRFPPLAEDVGFDNAALVHAATEGLWFMDVLKLSPFTPIQRKRLIKLLISVIDNADLSTPPIARTTQARPTAGRRKR